MNRIRELRKKQGLTQKELATQLQIADSTLSYWETGKYEPDNETLIKLSRFFSVPIDYILVGDFTEWGSDGESVVYSDVDIMRLTDSDMPVSEPEIPYNNNNKTQVAFNRIEFDGLTQTEIDTIAEYAAFIKSRREQ